MSQIPLDPKLAHIIDATNAAEQQQRQQQADPVLVMLRAIAITLDVTLQLEARIALGWDPAAAVREIGINVPEHDGTGLHEKPEEAAG